ncbi:MAG: hypothetical protein WD627_06880 [Actinomycetota bacterium]
MGNSSKLKLEEAVRRWRAAEQRLYPAVVSSPEGYDRYLVLVRAVTDELGSVRSTESLVDVYVDGVDLAAAAARGHMSTEGLDLDLALGAAFCLRYRELVAETRREEVQRRVDEAVDRGEEWVVIKEAPPWLQSPFPPWRRLEMHLPEGNGLHTWVEESLGDEGVEYGVEVVPLDPRTGQWVSGGSVTDRRTFSDYRVWQDEVEALKARYDGSDRFDRAREMGG